MKIRIILLLSLTACCWALDPNRRTNAGEQDTEATKRGNDVSINANQNGGSRGSGSFQGSVKNNVAQGGGHKAVKLSETALKADGNGNNYKVDKDGEGWTAKQVRGGKANVDYSQQTRGSEYKPVVTAGGKGLDNKLSNSGGSWNGEAVEQGNQNKYHFETVGGNNPTKAEIFDKGSKYATVDNLQNKGDIRIARVGNLPRGVPNSPKNGKASSVDQGRGISKNTYDAGVFNKQSASVNKDGSYVEIKKGLVRTSAKSPPGQNKAILSGSFITTGTATVEYTDASEEDCPYSAYSDRRDQSERNRKWKFSEPDFKIDYDRLQIDGAVDESGSSIKADWPQCFKIKIPIRFPAGTDLKKLAMGLAIYFPGCPRYVCAGRVCGLEFAAQAGTKVSESCWTDDLCKLKPVKSNKRKDDIIGFVAENAETTACDRPFNGGSLSYEATICQHDEDRGKNYKACPLFNFSPDESAARKKIVIVTRLYEKRPDTGSRGGLAGLFGGGGINLGSITGALANCDIKKYNLVGCREMGIDYKISAFGLQGDDKKYTGIDRKGTGTSSGGSGGSTGGNTGGGGWGTGGGGGGWGGIFGGNRGGGNQGGGGPVVDPAPETTTTTTTTTTASQASVPWWQKNNWWGRGNGRK